MEIIGKNYQIMYELETGTLTCQGVLQLYGADGYFSILEFEKNRAANKNSPPQDEAAGYASLAELFNALINRQPPTITVNIRQLKALNSSGINVLSKLAIKIRDRQKSRLVIHGSHEFPWQTKVLDNIKKILAEVIIVWE